MNARYMQIVGLLMAVLLVASPNLSAAQGGAVATGFAADATVGSIVRQIEASASNVIADIDDVVSARTFQLRTELAFLISEVEATGGRLIDKTFGELNESQQLFFENANRTVADISRSIKEGLEDADLLVTHVEQVIAQVPFTKKEPRVRATTPTFLVSQDTALTKEVAVEVRGSFLRHGDATLRIGDATCTTAGHTDSKINFVCDASAFIAEDRVTHRSGELLVGERRGFFGRIGGVFGKDRPTKRYVLAMSTVPMRMGLYSVEATVEYDEVITQRRSGQFGHVNPHCRSRRTSRTNFGPSGTGWKIDVGSIRWRFTNERRGSARQVNVSENGFQMEATARNSGTCAGPIRDARGAAVGVVEWTERKVVPKTRTEIVKAGDLVWGRDEDVNLPERLVGFKLIVERIDGGRDVLHTAKAERWFDVTRDAGSTSLVIAPREVEDALSR